MTRLANPNQGLPYDRISQDAQGNDEYGYRDVEGLEEVIHISSGKSNMEYHLPEKVTNYENCEHTFKIVNMGMREIECSNHLCRLITAFHPAINYREVEGKGYVRLNNKEYEIHA